MQARGLGQSVMPIMAVLLLATCGGDGTGSVDTTDTPTTTAPSTTATEAAPAPEPAGTSWTITDYALETGTITNVWPDTEVTIAFGSDGTVSGSTGCNDYGGPYATEGTYDPFEPGVPDPNDGQAITLGPLAVTEKACTPDHVMEQEAEFLALLDRAGRWLIAGDNLELRTHDGEFLIEAEPGG